MSIREAILGCLSWKPFTGYELKKFFADSLSFYWSGNSNQIYGTLVALHKEGCVSIEVQHQEKYPSRKVYTLTQEGQAELRTWLLGQPLLPEVRNLFQIQLAWAEPLSQAELEALFLAYEEELANHILMCRVTTARGRLNPARSEREALIWKRIEEGRARGYEAELDWARSLRMEIAALDAKILS